MTEVVIIRLSPSLGSKGVPGECSHSVVGERSRNPRWISEKFHITGLGGKVDRGSKEENLCAFDHIGTQRHLEQVVFA